MATELGIRRRWPVCLSGGRLDGMVGVLSSTPARQSYLSALQHEADQISERPIVGIRKWGERKVTGGGA